MESRLKKDKPRGLLTFRPPEGGFHHGRYLAAESLRPWIEHYWSVAWDLRGKKPHRAVTLPHPSVHWVFEKGKSRIGGIGTRRFTRVLQGRGRVFGIKFKPGAFYPFLQSPLSTLTNRFISPARVFGKESAQLEKSILAQEDPEKAADFADAFFLSRIPKTDPDLETVGRVTERVMTDRRILRVEDLVSHFHIPKRSLERHFRKYIGVGPKWVIQRYRLHEAIEQLGLGRHADWARMAQDLGYFDQAHFINDFKALVGESPLKFTRRLEKRKEEE